MNNDELLHKFANNKKLLFLTPNLIYITILFQRYYLNNDQFYLRNFFIVGLILFIVTTLIYLLSKIFIKDNKTIFYITLYTSLIYLYDFKPKMMLTFTFFYGLIYFAIFILMPRIKTNIKDTFTSILIFIIICYSIIGLPTPIYTIMSQKINTKVYKEKFNPNIEENLPTPNIYWIHTDGMMNIEDMNKYFKTYDKNLINYLEQEKFYYNESAELIASHKTQRALAAMFNPNFYDNTFKKYLYDLEDIFLKKETKTSYTISPKEIVEKRFNNELMQSLKEKDYTTIGIAKYNNHSSLKTDIYYDYYNAITNHWHFTEKEELHKLKNPTNNINLKHTGTQIIEVLSHSIFSKITNNIIPYKYDLVNYNNVDLTNYPYSNTSNYYPIKAIFKSLEETKEINKKFTFIDYDLYHIELSYDGSGNKLNPLNYYNLDYYDDNYKYANKLLIELLDYIKINDENSVIIIQADHGIHTIYEEDLNKKLNVNQEQIQEIRNSVMNAIYIPEKYQNGDEQYLKNPLNISRYIVNNYIGKNYEYIKD